MNLISSAPFRHHSSFSILHRRPVIYLAGDGFDLFHSYSLMPLFGPVCCPRCWWRGRQSLTGHQMYIDCSCWHVDLIFAFDNFIKRDVIQLVSWGSTLRISFHLLLLTIVITAFFHYPCRKGPIFSSGFFLFHFLIADFDHFWGGLVNFLLNLMVLSNFGWIG